MRVKPHVPDGECDVDHAKIKFAPNITCPLCSITRYLEVVEKRLNEAHSMVKYVTNTVKEWKRT